MFREELRAPSETDFAPPTSAEPATPSLRNVSPAACRTSRLWSEEAKV
eukprot:CAMPEP_0177570362 /NCGR_PEP_ID=MMETSP0369-20130122/76806_1 /TAXON_ID=447022 ORGANISM="Scrippsiella hangoei-like, Strain SHHI-4" /NCGR_SAMPLE_ID=MMETSP0369 /ASSEMBLY_ACC=CAM_ASM_000364 /LENGTH=47 /DNA_ID= /DNA_START= /DNA_END= /DNA_ORIENTATION=